MIAISLRYFEDAFNAVLAAAALPGITSNIAWPNRTYVPAKGVPYLKPEMAGRTRSPAGFGADSVQRWDGRYQVGVFAPRDTGTRLINEIASGVLALFPRGWAAQTPEGVWIRVVNGTAPAPVPFADWINQPVEITWFATEPP